MSQLVLSCDSEWIGNMTDLGTCPMAQTDTASEDSQTQNTKFSDETLYEKCQALTSNLWWTWHPDVLNLFRDLDPVRWRQLDHNPVVLLQEFSPERLASRASELVLHSRINHAYRRLRDYVDKKATWGRTHAGVLGARPVAYFSAEFGIHESIPIYSGGLGVLSGDHIKSASGLGIPLVAVGLLYAQGYFRQRTDESGYQTEEYVPTSVDDLPIQPAVDGDGHPITVSIETRDGVVSAKVWWMKVGRVNLYLLDCNVEGNKPEDRELTARLYGGDERTRVRQELVLGVGGVRALRALQITPGVYHLNEGHSAFAPLEVIRSQMSDDGLDFEEALRETAQQTVFTTHTPVPAGHDRFSATLVEEHLGPLRDELKLTEEQLLGLGRAVPDDTKELFCMTVLALKLSRHANAVSSLHGHISRRMWSHLWPGQAEAESPIGHITNGVHIPSWLAWQMRQLYDRHFEDGWIDRMGESSVWQRIFDVDPGELWETHNALKNVLLAFVRRRLIRQTRRQGESVVNEEAIRNLLDPQALTIGFGRRFATYKRADLLLRDLDCLDEMINHDRRPIQLVFAGKAHPKDEPGKQLIQRIISLRDDPRFAGRVVFIEDYDINVCRHLIQGVDVWLNNPRRPMEASGTSGQKVVLNGGLNLSILDGWWAEAYDGSNGFAIGHGTSHVDDRITDERDASSLYETLTNEVIPLYYSRNADGLPLEWIQRMMNSIASLAWRFSGHRMVMDYTLASYVPAAGGLSRQMPASS